MTLNGPRLAEFLRELEKDEAWQLHHQRELEGLPQREAFLMPQHGSVQTIKEADASPIELDLSNIPQYEVYH